MFRLRFHFLRWRHAVVLRSFASSTIAATCTGRRELLEVAAKERRPIYSRGRGCGAMVVVISMQQTKQFFKKWTRFCFLLIDSHCNKNDTIEWSGNIERTASPFYPEPDVEVLLVSVVEFLRFGRESLLRFLVQVAPHSTDLLQRTTHHLLRSTGRKKQMKIAAGVWGEETAEQIKWGLKCGLVDLALLGCCFQTTITTEISYKGAQNVFLSQHVVACYSSKNTTATPQFIPLDFWSRYRLQRPS